MLDNSNNSSSNNNDNSRQERVCADVCASSSRQELDTRAAPKVHVHRCTSKGSLAQRVKKSEAAQVNRQKQMHQQL